jgi:thiamine kinase-like enzyme
MPPTLEHLARRYIPGRGPVTIDRLGSGLVNQSYRVGREARVFSLRLTAPRAAELGLDRHWECRVLACAAAAGLAPAVERCEPRAGILVSCWAEGSVWNAEQAGAAETLDTVAQLARRVHLLPLLERARIVSVGQWIAFYRRSLERAGGAQSDGSADRPPASLDAAANCLVDALSQEPRPALALCHSDLHVQNLVITARGAPLILDWEYAHVSDPLWDLAGWICNGDLARAQCDLLLCLYLQREPTREEALRLARLAWLYDYVCLLWSELYLSSPSTVGAARDAVSMRAQCLTKRLAARFTEGLADGLAEGLADGLADGIAEALAATGRAGQVPAH